MTAKDMVAAFIRNVDAALRGGDGDPWRFLHPDLRVWINGTTPLSGCYPGLDIVRSVLIDTAAGVIDGARVRLIDMVGSGHRVGALLEIRAQARAGRTYNEAGDPAGCLFIIRDDRISDIRLFPDTTQIETVLFGRQFVPSRDRAAAEAGS